MSRRSPSSNSPSSPALEALTRPHDLSTSTAQSGRQSPTVSPTVTVIPAARQRNRDVLPAAASAAFPMTRQRARDDAASRDVTAPPAMLQQARDDPAAPALAAHPVAQPLAHEDSDQAAHAAAPAARQRARDDSTTTRAAQPPARSESSLAASAALPARTRRHHETVDTAAPAVPRISRQRAIELLDHATQVSPATAANAIPVTPRHNREGIRLHAAEGSVEEHRPRHRRQPAQLGPPSFLPTQTVDEDSTLRPWVELPIRSNTLNSDRQEAPMAPEPPQGRGRPRPSGTTPSRPLIHPNDLTTLAQATYHHLHDAPVTTSKRSLGPTPTPSSPGSRTYATSEGGATPDDTFTQPYYESEGLDLFAAPPDAETSETRFNAVNEITYDLQSRRNRSNDILGALELTLDATARDNAFPERVLQVLIQRGSRQVVRYRLHDEYTSHLVYVMNLASQTLTEYLRAVGSSRTFSFGHNSYNEGRTVVDLLYDNWATPQVVASVEERILRRVRTARRGIETFMESTSFVPSKGYPRVVSPTLTTSSVFARDVKYAITSTQTRSLSRSPIDEDAEWEAQTTEQIQLASENLTRHRKGSEISVKSVNQRATSRGPSNNVPLQSNNMPDRGPRGQ